MNKSDLVAADEFETLEGLVQSFAPKASILRTTEARVPPALVLAGYPIKEFEPENAHSSHLVAQNLPLEDPVNPQELAEKLSLDNAVLRAKGHMLSKLDNDMWTLQLVGKRHRLTRSTNSVTAGVVVLSLSPQTLS